MLDLYVRQRHVKHMLSFKFPSYLSTSCTKMSLVIFFFFQLFFVLIGLKDKSDLA